MQGPLLRMRAHFEERPSKSSWKGLDSESEGRQISDRVTRKQSVELSMVRINVSSFE